MGQLFLTVMRRVILSRNKIWIIEGSVSHLLTASLISLFLAEALLDGHHLLWSFPLTFSPLVQGGFRNGGMKMEVQGRMLYDCDFHESGYEATLKDQAVEIRIPFQRDGAQLKVNKKSNFSFTLVRDYI